MDGAEMTQELRFNAPPGWPSPPEGWRPEPGWKPDPSWPAAPQDWVFWVPAETSPPAGAQAMAPPVIAEPTRLPSSSAVPSSGSLPPDVARESAKVPLFGAR